jgi:hypothetical protein
MPTTTIEVEEATHCDALANPGKYTVSGGALIAQTPWPPALTPAATVHQQIAGVDAQLSALDDDLTPRMISEMAGGCTLTNPAWVDPTTNALQTAAQRNATIIAQKATLRVQRAALVAQLTPQ